MAEKPRLRLPAAAAAAAKRAAGLCGGKPVYVVGGALRDAALGRPIQDLDLACRGARALAKSLAAALGGSFVVLDEETGVYRAALPPSGSALNQVDVAELQGESIDEDLRRRDFTINALAQPAAGGALLDPRGGLEDCRRKLVRAEREELFRDDPLRLLRAFRIAAQLGFSIEAQTLELARKLRHRVRQPAGERVQAELLALLEVPGGSASLREMDSIGLLTALFEELEPARQCAVCYYGEGGVLKHSLDTAARADFLLQRLSDVFPKQAAGLERHLDLRSQPGAPHRALIVLTALLHDVAKPETAKSVDGRLRFFGHDTVGAKRTGDILKRLRFSRAQADCACAVVAQHLRPGHLAAGEAITEKAIYRFFRDLGEQAASLLLVCWADHASYLPQEKLARVLKTAAAPLDMGLSRLKPEDARKTVRHLQVIALLVSRLFDAKKPVPDRLVDGHEVMELLELSPGPEVGQLLERLREAQAEGKVRTRQEALDFIRRAK